LNETEQNINKVLKKTEEEERGKGKEERHIQRGARRTRKKERQIKTQKNVSR